MKETPLKRPHHMQDHGEGDHGEELWIVSYADMVTLLFGFFVILYSFSSLDDKKFDQMTQKVAEAFKSDEKLKSADADLGVAEEVRKTRALQMLVAMLNIGDSLEEAIPKIERSFASGKTAENALDLMVDKAAKDNAGIVGLVKTSEEDQFQKISLVLPSSTLFASGGYSLSAKAVRSLQNLAADLGHVADLTQIEVVGHTDSVPPRPNPVFNSNYVLSALRAGAVASVLTRHGVDEKKLVVKGLGSAEPLMPEYDQSGKAIQDHMAKNRRVVVNLKVKKASRKHAP